MERDPFLEDKKYKPEEAPANTDDIKEIAPRSKSPGRRKKSRWPRRIGQVALVAGAAAGFAGREKISPALEKGERFIAEKVESVERIFSSFESQTLFLLAQKDYSRLQAFRETLRSPIYWEDNGVLVLPRSIYVHLNLSFPGNIDLDLFGEVVGSIERECDRDNIAHAATYNLADFYEGTFSIDPDLVHRISPEIQKAILEKKMEQRRMPRFAQEVFSSNINGKTSLFVAYLDQKEGLLYIEDDPLVLEENDAALMEKLAQSVVKRAKEFRTYITGPATKKKGAYSRFFVPINDWYGAERAPKKITERLLAETTNEQFSERERKVLQEMERDGTDIQFKFLSQKSVSLSPAQLIRLGKIRFRDLKLVRIGDAIQSSIYSDMLGDFERTGELSSRLRLVRLDGQRVDVGSVDFGKFQSHPLGPYHYYEMVGDSTGASIEKDYDMDAVKKTLENMEMLFGQKPGTVIHRIVADSAKPWTGGTYRSYADTLAIFIDWASLVSGDKKQKLDLDLIARHEALHLLDDFFNITNTGEATETQEQLEARFAFHLFWKKSVIYFHTLVDQIAEGSLDTYNPLRDERSGHPWGDPGEFLASLGNSLFIYNPETRLAEKDVSFLVFYRTALSLVLKRLKSISGLEGTPMIQALTDRITLIKKILQDKGRVSGKSRSLPPETIP